jgi:hypothetical protein
MGDILRSFLNAETFIFGGLLAPDHLLPQPAYKSWNHWGDWEWEDDETAWGRRAGEAIAHFTDTETALAWLEDEYMPSLSVV